MESEKIEMGTEPLQVKSETIEPKVELIPNILENENDDLGIRCAPETNLSKLQLFKCDICNFETEYSNCYQLHLLLHTEIQTLKPVLLDKKPKYKCSICCLRIKTREELNQHQETHVDQCMTTKVFKCSLCSFQSKHNNDLTHHLKFHTEQDNIECNVCGFEAKNLQGLRQHQLVHENLLKHSRNDSHQHLHIPSYEISTSTGPLDPLLPDNYVKELETGQQNSCESKVTLHIENDIRKSEIFKAIEKISSDSATNLNNSRLECNDEEIPQHKPLKIQSVWTSEYDSDSNSSNCNLSPKSDEFIENEETHKKALLTTIEDPKVKMEKHERSDEEMNFMKAMELSKQGINIISGIDLDRIFIQESKNNQHCEAQLPLELFKCGLCNFQSKYKGYFRRHMQNHKKNSLLQCQACNFQAKSSSGLSRHQLMHNTSTKICEVCGFQAKSEIGFKRHMHKHSSTEANLDIKDSLKSDATESELHSFHAEYRAYLENHKEEEHLKCSMCGFESKTGGFLKRHMEIHMKEIPSMKCPLCPYQTTKSNAMKKHELTHKNILEVEVFSCHMCNFKTKWSCALKRHVDGHVNDFLYKCTMCSYESKHKHAFNRHLLVHKDPSEVRMFSCSECDFQTKRKKTLKVHLENHFTDKIYNCTVCPFKTKHKYILGRHMLVHQDKSNMEMFKCKECNFETKRKDTLKDHLIKHTLQKLENCNEVLIK